jgi:hypothetical protein
MLSIKNNDPKVGGLCTAWAACTPRRVFLLPLVFFPRPDSTLVVQVIEAPAERTYRYGTSFSYRQSSLTAPSGTAALPNRRILAPSSLNISKRTLLPRLVGLTRFLTFATAFRFATGLNVLSPP